MTARSDQGRIGYAWLFQAAIGAYAWVYLRLSLAVRRARSWRRTRRPPPRSDRR